MTDKHPPHKSYALKVLDKEHIKREKKTKYVLIERDTLKTLDGHPGIVRLYWTFQDQRSLCRFYPNLSDLPPMPLLFRLRPRACEERRTPQVDQEGAPTRSPHPAT